MKPTTHYEISIPEHGDHTRLYDHFDTHLPQIDNALANPQAVELAASNNTGPNSSPWGCGAISIVSGSAPGVSVSGESIVLQPGWYYITWYGRAGASPMTEPDAWLSLATGSAGGPSLLSVPIAVSQSAATLNGLIRVTSPTAYHPVVRITTAATVLMLHRFTLARIGRAA